MATSEIAFKVDTSAWDALIAKLEEARLLLLEIEALLVPEDADGATHPPPSLDTPA